MNQIERCFVIAEKCAYRLNMACPRKRLEFTLGYLTLGYIFMYLSLRLVKLVRYSNAFSFFNNK